MSLQGNIADNYATPEETKPFLGNDGLFIAEGDMTPETAGWVPVEMACP
jgi:hypothetical protein